MTMRHRVRRRRAARAFGGAAAFGVAVGVLTALSTATGTVVTLLGLLFAMIGGSLLALFRRSELSPAGRRGVLDLAGAVSLGIVVGLYLGFLTRYVDYRVRADLAADPAAAVTQPASGTGGSANRSGVPAPESFTGLQGGATENLHSLLTALDRQLKQPDLSAEHRRTLEELRSALVAAPFTKAVGDVSTLLEANPSPLRDDVFRTEFTSMFGAKKVQAAAGPSE